MSQTDYVISDQTGLSFLSDLNDNLAAIVSQNSGATEPATTYAYQLWADTTAGLLKIRNAANNAWISLLELATGYPVYDNSSSGLTATDMQNAIDEVNGLVGSSIVSTTITPALDADVTLTSVQYSSERLVLATGSWTTGHNIIVPNESRRWYINNTSGYTATIKTSAGTGISIPPGITRTLICDGTNVVVPQGSLGYDQVLYNLTGSRILGSIYTNVTNAPITVYITLGVTGTNTHAIQLDGSTIMGGQFASSGVNSQSYTLIVPPKSTYVATNTAGTIISWYEVG